MVRIEQICKLSLDGSEIPKMLRIGKTNYCVEDFEIIVLSESEVLFCWFMDNMPYSEIFKLSDFESENESIQLKIARTERLLDYYFEIIFG